MVTSEGIERLRHRKRKRLPVILHQHQHEHETLQQQSPLTGNSLFSRDTMCSRALSTVELLMQLIHLHDECPEMCNSSRYCNNECVLCSRKCSHEKTSDGRVTSSRKKEATVNYTSSSSLVYEEEENAASENTLSLSLTHTECGLLPLLSSQVKTCLSGDYFTFTSSSMCVTQYYLKRYRDS